VHGNDAVVIVGLKGVARAKATFAPRSFPFNSNAGVLLQPEARVAAGGVFYADGKGVVRRLDPSGAIREITTFPLTQSQQELAFAVSPDGRNLIATIVTRPPMGQMPPGGGIIPFGPGPWRVEVLAAAAGSPARTLWKEEYNRPKPDPLLNIVGWDDVAPVATVDTQLGTQQGTLGRQWFGRAARLDSSGRPGSILGGADCRPESELGDGTVACTDENFRSLGVSVRSADGKVLWSLPPGTATVAGPFTLSPNGQRLAFLRAGGRGVASVRSRDGSAVDMAERFFPQGWLDSNMVIGTRDEGVWSGLSLRDIAIVRLDAPDKIVNLGLKGSFVGVVSRGK
jgi:hypothetical protein